MSDFDIHIVIVWDSSQSNLCLVIIIYSLVGGSRNRIKSSLIGFSKLYNINVCQLQLGLFGNINTSTNFNSRSWKRAVGCVGRISLKEARLLRGFIAKPKLCAMTVKYVRLRQMQIDKNARKKYYVCGQDLWLVSVKLWLNSTLLQVLVIIIIIFVVQVQWNVKRKDIWKMLRLMFR